MTSSMADQQQQLCRRFSSSKMRSATGDFSDAHVIGRGGFGKVYKGLIDNGSVTVAVKRLASNSNQGEREFAAEMETLTKFRHRNLVSLIGYCNEEAEMILVYEYMTNGTLADHLYKISRNNGGSSLSWNQRLKICIGAGRGLDYLHTGCSIIHRDVKSTNILLDENFTAKVSDFGLAKTNILASHVSASVKGTFGYFDPSYFTTGRLTMASDTYAFGVVLLEVLTGRPAIGQRLAENELCMTMWAQERIRNGNADQIVALNLKGEISKGCLKKFVEVVTGCLHEEPNKRLTMNRVVAELQSALEQQERRGTTTQRIQFWPFWKIRGIQFWPFWPFWKRGSTVKDQNKVEVDEQPLQNSTPAIKEEKQSVDVQPVAAPTIKAEKQLQSVDVQPITIKEEKQRVDVQPIAAPTIRAVHHNVNKLPIYVPAIPVAEIKDITDDFSSKRMVYQGFKAGSVFHGKLKSGQDALIIKLNNELSDREFIAEVSKVSTMEHENVVKLYGYCLDGDLQVKVHEFAPRSLHDILHGRQGIKGSDSETRLVLPWAQRIKIAVGVATGLCYIHNKGHIHHNITSSNVLLFDDEIAKITNLHLSTQCSCRKAYVDELTYPPCLANHPPEYGWSDHTQKGDVYSFGVLLLELLTGKKEYDRTRGEGRHDLVLWARPQLGSDKVHGIVDPRYKADYPPKAVERMAEVAASCLQQVEFRPDMSVVLRKLK